MSLPRLLALPDGARWQDLAQDLTGDDPVVIGPGERTTVLAPVPGEVVIAGDGSAASGPASALARAATRAGRVRIDDGSVFHDLCFDDGRSLVVGGVLLDAERGLRPPVVIGRNEAAVRRLRSALADDGARDLTRILRYDDAADPQFALRKVGTDLLAGPFWTPAFCATVIRAAEAVGVFEPAEDDPVPGHEVSLAAISPRLYAHLEDDLLVRLLPQAQRWWPLVEYHGLRDAFVIKYSTFGQTELRAHHDVAQLSATIRLNDGFTGGALVFPRQGFSTAASAIGELVTWPSLVTHPHATEPITAGVKYGLTIWMELPQGYRRA
ncbi:MAG: hypothetical protein ACKO91_01310 [Acidimicrobiales bacterium]